MPCRVRLGWAQGGCLVREVIEALVTRVQMKSQIWQQIPPVEGKSENWEHEMEEMEPEVSLETRAPLSSR